MGNHRIDRLFRRYVRKGDVQALGKAFDQSAPELLGLARHLVRNEAEAEDVLQAAFLTALEKAGTFEEERSFLPWMVGILSLQARKSRSAQARTPEPRRLEAREVPDPASDAERTEFRDAVDRAVGRLPETYRDVLSMHLARGAGAAEVARELGLDAGTVRVRIHRGLKLLRDVLPAGFAAGTAAVLAPGRGLAAVRDDVVAAAARRATHAAALAAPVSTVPLLSGLTSAQRLAVFAACLVVLVGGALVFKGSAARGSELTPLVEESRVTLDGDDATVAAAVKEDGGEGAAARIEVRAQASPVSGATTFSLRVFDAESDRPLEGATLVTLTGGARTERGSSDEDGVVRFEADAADWDELVVERAGYAPWRAAPSGATADIAAAAEVPFEETAAAPGEPVRAVLQPPPADPFAARPRARSLGTAFLDRGTQLVGRVVREGDRQPVAGAHLYYFQALATQPAIDRAVGVSLADGRLSLNQLLPRPDAGGGRSVLVALHDEGFGWTALPDLTAREELRDVEVIVRPTADHEVEVEDGNGAPVVGARVQVAPVFAGLPGQWILNDAGGLPRELRAVFEQETDAAGSARFPSLPAPDEDADTLPEIPNFQLSVHAAGHVEHREYMRVQRGESTEQTVRLGVARSVDLEVEVRDEEGTALEGVQVEVRVGRTEGLGLEHLGTEVSDAQGTVLVAGLDPAREVHLSARAEGFVYFHRRLEDEELLSGRYAMRLARPLPVRGRVVDQAGRGVEGATVHLLRDRRQVRATRKTSADGSFVVADATAGAWSMSVTPPEPRNEWVMEPLEVSAGEEKVLFVLRRVPPPPGSLVVKLVDRATGADLEATEVNLHRVDEELEPDVQGLPDVRTNSAGSVTAEGLRLGEWVLWACVPGKATVMHRFTITAEQPEARARIEFGGPGTLQGTLDLSRVAAERRSAARVIAVLDAGTYVPYGGSFAQGSQLFGQALPDADGRFELEDLTPGPYSVRVVGDGVCSVPVVVEVRGEEASEVRLTARPAAFLRFVSRERFERSGFFSLELKGDEGDWELADRRTVDAGEVVDAGVWRTPGVTAWRATFHPRSPASAEDSLYAPLEGSVVLEAERESLVEVELRGE